jgi:hypothetical protein
MDLNRQARRGRRKPRRRRPADNANAIDDTPVLKKFRQKINMIHALPFRDAPDIKQAFVSVMETMYQMTERTLALEERLLTYSPRELWGLLGEPFRRKAKELGEAFVVGTPYADVKSDDYKARKELCQNMVNGLQNYTTSMRTDTSVCRTG